MKLFYSISFSDFPIAHHGEVKYNMITTHTHEESQKAMIEICKKAAEKSRKKWGFKPEQMISVDFYYYRGSEETIFYKWRKKTETSTIK